MFLDAELYIDRVRAPEVCERLWSEGELRASTCLYLSYGEASERHLDFTCTEAFADSLVQDLLPWIEDTVGGQEGFLLCGLSLSGLVAIFTILRHPTRFAGALSQSPSAWWNGEWLSGNVPTLASPSNRAWISVGTQEVGEGIYHGPNLFQETSQIASCRRLSDAVRAALGEVRYSEFEGGHDPACWAAELPSALRWLRDGLMFGLR